MNHETFDHESQQNNERIDESYIDPEKLDVEKLESLLNEGEINNIRLIESHHQKVSPHADKVLIADVAHADKMFEAEIQIPGEDKKILVVYKPENGKNNGTDTGEQIPLPKESSPYMNKEVAAWIVAKNLGLAQMVEPVVIRSLNEGPGSVRPYIWGEPVELVDEEKQNEIYNHHETIEDFALYDYILQTLDRKPGNMILEDVDGQSKLKAIDHSLTFFDEDYSSRWHKKGPRLRIAYDTSSDPEILKKTPLPERHTAALDQFIKNSQNIRDDLSKLLSEKEINDVFNHIQKLSEQKIFL